VTYMDALFIVCDYFSNFIEVESIQRVTTHGVSKALKTMFSSYGVPNQLVTDNGPQFASAEFVTFSKSWGFDHISSPRYPQSNGKAENAVKTVKRLLTKCRETGQSEYLALLDWRKGCRCKTLLPVSGSLLQPRYPTKEDALALQ